MVNRLIKAGADLKRMVEPADSPFFLRFVALFCWQGASFDKKQVSFHAAPFLSYGML